MILNEKYSDKSRYSGKVLLSVIMLGFISIALVVFMRYGPNVIAVSSLADSHLAAFNAPVSTKNKREIGVVTGITYNTSSPCALVNETIVHPGDTIHKITVVAIKNNAVMFAKGDRTWQQKVLETPNRAWPNSAN